MTTRVPHNISDFMLETDEAKAFAMIEGHVDEKRREKEYPNKTRQQMIQEHRSRWRARHNQKKYTLKRDTTPTLTIKMPEEPVLSINMTTAEINNTRDEYKKQLQQLLTNVDKLRQVIQEKLKEAGGFDIDDVPLGEWKYADEEIVLRAK
jgi:plasmid replication initiation protein